MQEIQIKDIVQQWLARNFPRFVANIPTYSDNCRLNVQEGWSTCAPMCPSKFSGDGYESIGKGIYYTPEIALWLNAKDTRENHRRVFFKKIDNLREDITKYQRPRRARAKIIPSVEAPVYTIRLENNEGIRILFDYKSHTGGVEIFVISVSNKKEFQSKLKKSSEHIVHASSFDRIPWDEDHEELDLENCTNDDLKKFKQKAKQHFNSLPEDEKSWTVEEMEKRTKRATIYNFCLPNIIDISTLMDNEDFLIPQILKLQEHQKELMDNQNNQFLLEGVAGTGKTTILLYRFVSDVKNYAKEIGEIGTDTLFITHNKKLKDDILLSLKLFFPDSEIEEVSKCVKTVDELFKDLITDKKDPEAELNKFLEMVSVEYPELVEKVAEKEVHNTLIKAEKNDEIGWAEHFVAIFEEMNITLTEPEQEMKEPKEEKYLKEKKLTREKFRMQFRKNKIDIDLFYEEYRGLLRGYNLNGENRIISEEEYMGIGRRRGRLQKVQRSEFYSLAEKIESELKESSLIDPQNGGWDNLDLCKEIIARIKENKILCDLEYLYVDEVQDLTAAEIEVLLTLMNKNDDGKLRIAMAGDLSQSIQPSSFTWQVLSDVIYNVLDIKVEKHQTLVENYRSTPYLVWAANHILKLQSELDGESATELQRPYADENYGEPGLVFFASEKELANQLATNNLPNAACPMLVRDEVVKQKMKTLLPNTHHFVETIAKFKGLEKKNILLWQPDSGTECELDLREDPNRGKMAKQKEYSDSTALLELRHVFVGFTRARYLMGICAPKDDKSFFLKKAIENCDSIEDADISKLPLFDSEIEYEDYVEFAREYENAGQWGMAAESYRNCKYEHNHHYCLGMEAVEKGEWIRAINCFSEACLIPGEKTTESRRKIAEYSKFALDETLERQARSSLIAKILHNAETQLSKSQRNRLLGEKAEERRNWPKSATYYIAAKDIKRASYVIEKIEDESVKIGYYIEIGDEKKAMVHVKEIISKQKPKLAISIALGMKGALDVVFKDKLAAMRKHFENPDISWAMTLANGDKKLLNYINKHKGNLLLKRKNSNRSEEREVFRHLIKTKNAKELDKRSDKWKHLDHDEVALEQFEMQNEKKYFLQALQSVNPEWGHYEKYLRKFEKMFPQNSMIGLSIITYFNDEKIKFEMKSDSKLSQEIWTYSILAETIRLNEFQHKIYITKLENEMFNAERSTSSMVSMLLILLFAQRNPKNDINLNTLFSADIISCSLAPAASVFKNYMLCASLIFVQNYSKFDSMKIRSSFTTCLSKRASTPNEFYQHLFTNCYILVGEMDYNDFKLIIPFPKKLTPSVFGKIEKQFIWIEAKEKKNLRKEWKKQFGSYSKPLFRIGKADFDRIKTIKKLPTILENPLFENIFNAETSKKETSPKLEETPIEEPKSIEEVVNEEEIVEDEVQIMAEEFDDIDFSELINENKEQLEEQIQFNAEDIADLDKDSKGESHVKFFEQKLEEIKMSGDINYAKALIEYSDYSFQSDCGLHIHLRFALMIAINNEAKKLKSLPEAINIFQTSDIQQRRLFMADPRNQAAILSTHTIYSRRILNQNL